MKENREINEESKKQRKEDSKEFRRREDVCINTEDELGQITESRTKGI